MGFQDNLRKYRVARGLNAKDFAALLGIKYTTYLSYETAGKEPKIDNLCKIAEALHVSTDDLLGYYPDKFAYWKSLLEGDDITIEKIENTVKVTSRGFTSEALPIDYFIDILEAIKGESEDLLKPSRDMMIKSRLHEFVIDSVISLANDQKPIQIYPLSRTKK